MPTNHLTFEEKWSIQLEAGNLIVVSWPGDQVGYGIILKSLGLSEIGMGVYEVLTSTGKIMSLTSAVIYPLEDECIPDWVHEYLNTGTWVGPNAWRLKVQPT